MIKQLHNAASEGHVQEVQKLLSQGVSVHCYGPIGMNPLHLAAMNGHIDVCKLLITIGVVTDCFNKIGKSPLHLAAANGHSDVVNYLLHAGASANHQDMLLMTPLHWACARGYMDVVHILLHHNADPYCLNKYNKTPLMLATENHHINITFFIENYLLTPDQEMKSVSPPLTDKDELESDFEAPNRPNCSAAADEVVAADIQDESSEIRVDRSDFNSDDEDSKIQDSLLASLSELEEAVCAGNMETPYEFCFEGVSELLRAEAALESFGDPSRVLLKALSNGGTFHLTEAGVQALDMIKPDTLLIPSESQQKEESEDEEELRRKDSVSQPVASSSSKTCNAVVLHTQANDLKDLFHRAFSSMATPGNASSVRNLDETSFAGESPSTSTIETEWPQSEPLDEEMPDVESLIDFVNLPDNFEFLPDLSTTTSLDLYSDDILDETFDTQHLWTQLPFPSTSSEPSSSKGPPPTKKTKL